MSNVAKSLAYDEVAIGDALPELVIEVGAQLIVGGAIASRDFQDVHHDKAGSQALGSPDIFMNILTTNGLVGRYITDWTGPEAVLKKVSIKLGAPNYPGETMTFSGSVVAKDDADKVVDVEVRGKNGFGYHVTGTVRVALS